MGGGVAAQFVTGGASSAIDRGRQAGGGTGAVPQDSSAERDLVAGALADKLTAPGLSPWVGARAGIGFTSDAGVTWTGRSVRIDGRHAFESKHYALSIGLGASGVLSQPGADKPGQTSRGGRDIPGVDSAGASGWGLDVPVLVGYRSSASLVQVWGGIRGGFEHIGGDFYLRTDLGSDHRTDRARGCPALVCRRLDWRRGRNRTVLAGSRAGRCLPVAAGLAQVGRCRGGTRSIGATLSGLTVGPGGALAARF